LLLLIFLSIHLFKVQIENESRIVGGFFFFGTTVVLIRFSRARQENSVFWGITA